mmetsp:Transcript_6240/g.15054  ORF Transcript_6240/g.15054 Transcript_6240/m.15054 type:complete len:103 (+) Transcript_6240:1277-1585(+)
MLHSSLQLYFLRLDRKSGLKTGSTSRHRTIIYITVAYEISLFLSSLYLLERSFDKVDQYLNTCDPIDGYVKLNCISICLLKWKGERARQACNDTLSIITTRK